MRFILKQPGARIDSSPRKTHGAGSAAGRGSFPAVSNQRMVSALQAQIPVAAGHPARGDATITAPGDAVEAQAERMADAALRADTSAAPPAPVSSPPADSRLLPSISGEPLPPALRSDFEPRFGADFSHVRIHRGEGASQAAASFAARAYTVGSHIVFGRGQFAPDSMWGRKLIAHELGHVAQGGPRASHEVRRVAWTPTHADERSSTGADRFASQTFELSIPALTRDRGTVKTQNIDVSIFVPANAKPDRNKVHVFFSPGEATQSGLAPAAVGMNAAMTHGFRAASDTTEWILISVPGRDNSDIDFNTIDTVGVQACLKAAGRARTGIDALRFSSHSRGSRGLTATLKNKLIPTPVPERVVVFDAAFPSLSKALASSGIPGGRMFAIRVNDLRTLTVPGAHNTGDQPGKPAKSGSAGLSPEAMRAIGYTRIIQDAMTTMPTLVIPKAVRAQLLTLPARGLFSTLSPPPPGMVNIEAYAATNKAAIDAIVKHENDPLSGLKTFIDNNNLIRLGVKFTAGIYSHHLFVAELAHEVVD
jgi:hypothetical protein